MVNKVGNPLFSVIIPVYNCEKYLYKCLDSLLFQKYNNYELIIINDGSTDNTLKIINKYNIKFNNIIKIITKNNEGVSAARNDGMRIAKGKYITFIDCDDYVSADYFINLEHIIKKNKDIDLYNFGFFSEVENKHGKMISQDIINYKEVLYNSRKDIQKNLISLYDSTMLYNPVNKIYKRNIIEKFQIKFPNYNWGEDVEFNRLYLNNINSFYNSDICLYHYVRERSNSITKKYKKDLFKIRKKEFFEFNQYFEKWKINKNDYYEFSCRRYIERILGCIENEFCSSSKFKTKYLNIKLMINDEVTREALNNTVPKSKKIKIMLIPLKYKLTLTTYIMGMLIHKIKKFSPSIFNKLKNKR